MKVIIAGTVEITDYDLVCRVISEAPFKITEVVCGMAKGVDRLGKRWADERGIPVKEMPAEWEKYGRAAGMIRNKEMSLIADCLIAVWDGQSPGTKNMITCMRRLGKPRHIHIIGHNDIFDSISNTF